MGTRQLLEKLEEFLRCTNFRLERSIKILILSCNKNQVEFRP